MYGLVLMASMSGAFAPVGSGGPIPVGGTLSSDCRGFYVGSGGISPQWHGYPNVPDYNFRFGAHNGRSGNTNATAGGACYGLGSCTGSRGGSGAGANGGLYAPSWVPSEFRGVRHIACNGGPSTANAYPGMFFRPDLHTCYGYHGSYNCLGVYSIYPTVGTGCYGAGFPRQISYDPPAARDTPKADDAPKAETPAAPKVEPKVEPGLDKPAPEKKPEEKPTAAELRVELPADAVLYAAGVATRQTGPVRAFRTPALAAGRDYYYELRAEVVRDGKTLSRTRRVVVRAGDTNVVQFDEPGAAE